VFLQHGGGNLDVFGQSRDRGVGTSELLQNAAPGGVRERGERGIEPSLHILNHTVQYTLHESADASAVVPENKIVPHSSRERPGDVKKRQGRLERRIRRSGPGSVHRRKVARLGSRTLSRWDDE